MPLDVRGQARPIKPFEPYCLYLHVNGEIIKKPKRVLDMDPEYFDSPFVQKYWVINSPEDLKEVNKYLRDRLSVESDHD